jgi:hypothetical protein
VTRRIEYASHQRALLAAVLRTAGPVLELGAGDFSTPLLHEVCRGGRRPLLTLESDPIWYGRFAAFASSSHRVELVTDWNTCTAIDEARWSVVFIDHDPMARRVRELERVKGVVGVEGPRFVVVHDTEPAYRHQYPGLQDMLNAFSYRRDFVELEPWTTVVSDTGPIWDD